MTFIEKIIEANPNCDPQAVTMFTCPEDFGLEKPLSPCPAMETVICREACEKCWNREYIGEGGDSAE